MTPQEQCYALMEKVLQVYAGEEFSDEVKKAKSEFFDFAGILDEKAENYDLRMNQLFDWYLFTRPLSGYAQTPLEAAPLSRQLRFSHEEHVWLDALKNHRHGIFELIKLKGSDMVLRDLLKNEKLTVKDCPWAEGFQADELFEARLIPADGNWIMTKGLCFHPADARKFILNEIKRHRKDSDLDPDDMMLKLLKMRYRFERYQHLNIDRIYNHEPLRGA